MISPRPNDTKSSNLLSKITFERFQPTSCSMSSKLKAQLLSVTESSNMHCTCLSIFICMITGEMSVLRGGPLRTEKHCLRVWPRGTSEPSGSQKVISLRGIALKFLGSCQAANFASTQVVFILKSCKCVAGSMELQDSSNTSATCNSGQPHSQPGKYNFASWYTVDSRYRLQLGRVMVCNLYRMCTSIQGCQLLVQVHL